jgi:2-desacetyl-2-hydroxyethyl bacteriochlorophyllide A dehydrogenase
MKAVLLEEIGKLTLTEAPQPDLSGPDEVLIKVGAVGICGSEVHAYKGTHPFRKPPSIQGHEVTGDIVAVGANAGELKPGDRVFVDPQWTCGECVWCRSGRHNLCPTKKVLGTIGWSGALGEYIKAPKRSVYRLPDDVSYVDGTLIEPLSVAVHAAERAGVIPDESIAVLGTGPIGMMVTAVCSARGAAPIIALDLQPHCLEIAQKHLGATDSLLADPGPIADRILDITDGKGIDVVFLTVGVSPLVTDALDIVEREGRVVFLALFDEPVHFEPFDIVGRDVTMLGSQMYNAQDIRTAIQLISTGAVQAGAMVTHVLPLEEAQRGFDLAATKADGAVKVVLRM